MDINYIKKDALEYVVIDDLYTKEELYNIYEELNLLLPHIYDASFTGVSKNKNDVPKKNCSGMFLDDFYGIERTKSNILQVNRKIFSDELIEKLVSFSAYFRHLKNCKVDYTLLNYYKDSEHYLPHHDESILSAITTFQIGDFKGGDFCFTDYNEIISYKENRCIIFAGCINHEAKPIIADKNSRRISMAQFMNYK